MGSGIDLLDRKVFIDNTVKLVKQLSDIRKGCCFAIEGSWGIGKTFVIEKIEEQLKENTSEDTNSDRYFVFHYNCWQHDYYEEPAVAIISAMLSSIQEDNALVNEDVEKVVKAGYKFVSKKLSEIAGLYLENKIGVNIVEWVTEISDIKEDDEKVAFEFDKMFNFSQTIEKVRKNLQEIAKNRTLVLMVDELDRCIPSYAIKVLERLHHIFYGLDNVVVILAIDRTQLEHSIEEMFGIKENSIDIEKYLKKFIDFSMVLDNGNVNKSFVEKYKFYFEKFKKDGVLFEYEEIFEFIPMLLQGIDIRKQEKIFEKANIVHSLICTEEVDMSVLVFEIMYEVLQEWKFGNMEYVARIGDSHYVDLEKRLGKEKIDFLILIEKKAWSGKCLGDEIGKKKLLKNLYSKVFWYFASIFIENSYYKENFGDKLVNELEVARKYCDYCNIIK